MNNIETFISKVGNSNITGEDTKLSSFALSKTLAPLTRSKIMYNENTDRFCVMDENNICYNVKGKFNKTEYIKEVEPELLDKMNELLELNISNMYDNEFV